MKAPDDKPLVVHARAVREFIDPGRVDRLYCFGTDDMLAYCWASGSMDREALIASCLEGIWRLQSEYAMHWSPRAGAG